MSVMQPAGGARLKLLCLHGYMQDAQVFQKRVEGLSKRLKSVVELVFLDAPFEGDKPAEHSRAPAPGPKVYKSVRGRSWWQWTGNQGVATATRPSTGAGVISGWDVTLGVLAAAVREHRPDGLLGFSQGALAVSLLLAGLQSDGPEGAAGRLLKDVTPPRFAVLVAGSNSRDPTQAEQLRRAAPLLAPCFFVYGEVDEVLPLDRTLDLLKDWAPHTTQVHRHPGGHFVPALRGEFKDQLLAFLEAQRLGGPGQAAPG